jgi:hypothetical protein
VLLADAHLCDRVKLLAAITLDQMEIGPDLPVDFFPRDTIGFTDKSYEFFQIPVSVDDVLCPHLAVAVYEVRALATCEYLALLLGKQLVAVGALVQVVFLLFKQELELLHE